MKLEQPIGEKQEELLPIEKSNNNLETVDDSNPISETHNDFMPPVNSTNNTEIVVNSEVPNGGVQSTSKYQKANNTDSSSIKCFNPQLDYSTEKIWGIIDYSYVGAQVFPRLIAIIVAERGKLRNDKNNGCGT